MSQADFASIFNLARPSVGAYEEGRSEPKIDTVIQIAKHFGISIDLLLTKALTVNDLFQIDSFNEKLDKAHRKGGLKDSENTPIDIPIIRLGDQIEYLVNRKNKKFLENLPKIQLPKYTNGEIRAFENNGSEMEINQKGIRHGDLLIGALSKKPSANSVVLIVTQDTIICRRLIKIAQKDVLFKPDNPNYDEIRLDKNEILELWEVSTLISESTSAPKNLEEKVLKMEQQLEQIAKSLNK